MRICYGSNGNVIAYDYTDEIMAYLAGDTHAMDYLDCAESETEETVS